MGGRRPPIDLNRVNVLLKNVRMDENNSYLKNRVKLSLDRIIRCGLW
jgi:hypothetical protein